MRSKIPWGVHQLRHMIALPGIDSPEGRCVPEPFPTTFPERLRAAWWVLTGRAHAVIWPKAGELENAINGEGQSGD